MGAYYQPLAKMFAAICILGFVLSVFSVPSQAETQAPSARHWSDPAHKAELRRKLDEFRYSGKFKSQSQLVRYPKPPELNPQFIPKKPSLQLTFIYLVMFASTALLFIFSKSTVQKGLAKMSSEPSNVELEIKQGSSPAILESERRVETWRDAALFFAVAASSTLMFSKIGVKFVSACSTIRMETPTRGFDGVWIIRVLTALFVACISVYLFKRYAKDTENRLRNSLACNLGLAFVAVALLFTHSNGIQIISFVGDCARIVPGAPNQF